MLLAAIDVFAGGAALGIDWVIKNKALEHERPSALAPHHTDEELNTLPEGAVQDALNQARIEHDIHTEESNLLHRPERRDPLQS